MTFLVLSQIPNIAVVSDISNRPQIDVGNVRSLREYVVRSISGRCLMNAGLSCRRVWNLRPRKPKKSERRLSQISLWLKLAVFFALTMARADVREFLALFGHVSLDALGSPDARPLSRVFEGPFQENGLLGPWQVGPVAEEQELITGPPIVRSFGKWVPVTSPSLEMSMRLERSVAYLIFKTPGLPQDGLGRATLPTAPRKRSSLIFLPVTSMDNEEQQDVGKRRRISAGMVTEDVERRVSQRLARGSIGSLVWNSGVRDQDVEFCILDTLYLGTRIL